MRKAPVGLFNIKKSKNKETEEFEASDEWLMGLADDQDDQFDPIGGGPNASIPQGLASLAPSEDRRFDPLLADHEPSSFDQSDSSELLESDDVDLSSWHFPDLAQPAAEDIGGHLGGHGDELIPATGVSPFSETLSAEMGAPDDMPSDGLPSEALPSEAQATDTYFDEHWSDGSTFDPFPDGQAPEPELESLADDRRDDSQDENDPDIEDAAIEDAVLEEPLLDHDHDDDNVDVMAAIGSDPLPPVESLPQVELQSHPVVAPGTDGLVEQGSTSDPVPRGREADMLCEILGVEGGASWADLRAAHAAAMSEYDPRLESDEDRVALASAIRREMNSTYAALRLLAAG